MLRAVPPLPEDTPTNDLDGRSQPPVRLRDSEISEIFFEVHEAIMKGRVRTFAQANAILQLRGIPHPLDNRAFGFGDSNLDEQAGDLRTLVQGVEQGFHPGLVHARKTFAFINQFPANLGTLRLLRDLEKEHEDAPYFDQFYRELGAIRLVKTQQLAQYFHERLQKFMENEYDSKEALSFQSSFFGREGSFGCGLKIEDLPLSPTERMMMNRIRAEKRGVNVTKAMNAKESLKYLKNIK